MDTSELRTGFKLIKDDQPWLVADCQFVKPGKGQAFFLHNRVETIDETAERLRGLCPDLRFEVAHGQMDEGELEARVRALVAEREKQLAPTAG